MKIITKAEAQKIVEQEAQVPDTFIQAINHMIIEGYRDNKKVITISQLCSNLSNAQWNKLKNFLCDGGYKVNGRYETDEQRPCQYIDVFLY